MNARRRSSDDEGNRSESGELLNWIASRLGRERRTGGVAVPEWAHQPQYKTLEGYSADDLVTVLKTIVSKSIQS